MAHFAKINKNNIVTEVVVVDNENLLDKNSQEQEEIGIEFCRSVFGVDTTWVQTSYNGSIRYNYATIGSIWDANNNAFYEQQPYPKWVLNSQYKWEAPVPVPVDGDTIIYRWDVESESWVA